MVSIKQHLVRGTQDDHVQTIRQQVSSFSIISLLSSGIKQDLARFFGFPRI
jgi:hypothetical protein